MGPSQFLGKRVYRHNVWGLLEESDTDDDGTDFPAPDTIKDWCEPLPQDVPPIKEDVVESYFIHRKNPLTANSLNAKRVFKKARQFLEENYVSGLKFSNICASSPVAYFTALCQASMKPESRHIFISLSKTSGMINHCTCNCTAGKSEICSHIGAVLLLIVKFRGTCTANPCSWKSPRNPQQRLSPKKICDIRFKKTDTPTTWKIKPYPDIHKSSTLTNPDGFYEDLMSGLKEINPGLFEMTFLNSSTVVLMCIY